MKSFLDKINDTSLAWTADDVDDDDISFSSSSFSSSSSDGDYLDEDDDDDSLGGMDNANGGRPLHVDAVQAVEAEAAGRGGGAVAEAVNLDVNHDDVEANANAEAEAVAHGEHHGIAEGAWGEHPSNIVNVSLVAAAAAAPNNPRNEVPIGTATNNPTLQNIRNHALSSTILFRVARCEELPLIRAEIDWKLFLKQIPSYPASDLGDELGAHLLQSALRNDPPTEVIRDIIKLYPKSCVNMDSFYAACQHASDDAVQLVMRRTMKARKVEGISWGMLAFLGDARIRLRHAQFLCRCVPEALVDPMHGMFGVSPLDRMASGAFIHGGYAEWVAKLKLALRTAAETEAARHHHHHHHHQQDGQSHSSTSSSASSSSSPSPPLFHPFHALVRRLVSSDFMGVQFGALSFINSLTACVESETSDPPFHQVDERGNLPLHVVLQQDCDTNLGDMGERKLLKFLLNANPGSAMVRDDKGKLPVVLAVEHGWPVYDIIVNACPPEYKEGVNSSAPTVSAVSAVSQASSAASAASENGGGSSLKNQPQPHYENLLLHDVLSCKFHQRFGVSGARSVIKYILKHFPSSARVPNSDGRLPLHIGVENGWPCHDLLVAAAPSALEVRDPQTGFYPFILATSSKMQVVNNGEKQGLMELSALYELIRWGPLLLRGRGRNVKTAKEEDGGLKRKLDDHGQLIEQPAKKKAC